MGGLVLVASNDQLAEQQRQQGEQQRQINEQVESAGQRQVETDLAAYIRKRLEIHRRAKEPHEQRMIRYLHALNGRYDAQKLQQIREQGLPEIWMNITSTKVRAAHSWIRDVLMPAGDKPWSLKPTPMPTLPPEIDAQVKERVQTDAMMYVQATGQMVTPQMIDMVHDKYAELVKQEIDKKAELAAEKMSDLIHDQLIEGGWDSEFDQVLNDLCSWPAAILKSPVLRNESRLSWDRQSGSVQVNGKVVPKSERCDPFNIYPQPGIVSPDDGDMIEIHEWSKADLYDLIGLPGFKEQELRVAIQEFSSAGRLWGRESLRSQQRHARGDTQSMDQDDGTIDAIEFWGAVSGQMLLDWGMPAERIEDAERSYQVMAILVGTHVVCVRFNPDPLGKKPYSKACFDPIPGSFWGRAIPELIEDCQDVCNAAARSLVANMAVSSGPQVAVNTASIPHGQDVTAVFPWKIWQLDFSKTGNSSRPPIEFFQPNAMTAELLNVFDRFSRMADEYSGIPAYTYGSSENMGGAARTASGLSMLMNAGSKSIKNVVKQVDAGIISPTIERYYNLNMLFHPDPAVKGDVQIVARGALSLVAKEQNQMRVQEFLGQTANPIDMQIMGVDGRAALLRRAAQGLDLGSDEAVPDEEELRQRMAQMMGAPAGAPAGQPAAPREANAAGQPMGQQQ